MILIFSILWLFQILICTLPVLVLFLFPVSFFVFKFTWWFCFLPYDCQGSYGEQEFECMLLYALEKHYFFFLFPNIYLFIFLKICLIFLCQQLFNSKLVLASPETATDADYAAILGVIGHEVCRLLNCIFEGRSYLDFQIGGLKFFVMICVSFPFILQYFHNWTGNRLVYIPFLNNKLLDTPYDTFVLNQFDFFCAF